MTKTANPHVKWTMQYSLEALYGTGPKRYLSASFAYWTRDREELEEMYNLQQLGRYEWKDEIKWILNHFEEYSGKDKKKETLLSRIWYLASKLSLMSSSTRTSTTNAVENNTRFIHHRSSSRLMNSRRPNLSSMHSSAV